MGDRLVFQTEFLTPWGRPSASLGGSREDTGGGVSITLFRRAPDYLEEVSLAVFDLYAGDEEARIGVRAAQLWVMSPETDAACEERGLALLAALDLLAPDREAQRTALCSFAAQQLTLPPYPLLKAWNVAAARYREREERDGARVR